MAAAQKRLDAKEERLFQAFRQFDLDGDGHITAEEMKKGAVSLPLLFLFPLSFESFFSIDSCLQCWRRLTMTKSRL